MADATDTDAAGAMLATHTGMAWLVEREIERDPAARDSLLAFTAERMIRLVRLHPDLHRAADAACGIVARAADGKSVPVRLHG